MPKPQNTTQDSGTTVESAANVTTPVQESVPAIVAEESAVPAVPSDSVDNAALLAAMEKSDSLDKMQSVMKLTAKYIELEKPSESFRGVFIGMGEINVNDKNTGEVKSIPAARFIINKQVFINAGAVLVTEINRSGVPVGTPLEVTYERKEGNTKIYSITLLG